MMSSDRVLIIGGGLGLAHGLQRAGIPFDIFEREAAIGSRTQGYRLRIDAAGQSALARCVPADLVYLLHMTASCAVAEPWFIGTDLDVVAMEAPESWSRRTAVAPDLCVHRQTLREILQCGLARRIHYDHRLDRFEDEGDGVVAHFTNGARAAGGLLVGADGAGSAVRRLLLPDAIPQETAFACIYGRTPATLDICAMAGPDLCAGTSVVHADGFAGIIDVMTFRQPLQALASRISADCWLSAVDDYFYWALIGPGERLGVAALPTTGGDLEAAVGPLVQDWAPALQALILRGDPADRAVHPVRILRPGQSWDAGSVTLLGEAAHVMSPAGGRGASTALQDAADLVAQIDAIWDAHPRVGGLRGYEDAMRTRGAEAVRQSLEGSKRLSQAKAA